jgi:4-amino-4-deoxy-L-arabinose transferase-like glycosyltransferase
MPHPARRARAALAVPLGLVLLVLMAALLATGCWRVYSNTWDEPEHLAAGLELLDRGKYEYDTEHPPLGRVLLALPPYLAGAHSFGTPPPEGTPEGIDILYSGGHYWRYLTLARAGALPFLALLLFATWLWGQRVCGSREAALLPVALLVTVPPVLGHAALASLDVAAAATILLALYALERWLLSGQRRHAVLFGLASGLAVVTKFSAVPFIGLGLLVLAVARAVVGSGPTAPAAGGGARWPQWLRGLALAAVALLVPVWIAYGPRAHNPAGVALRFDWAVSYLLLQPGLDHSFGVLLSHLWLPRELKDLVNGMVAVKAHNDTGHLSYLLGEVASHGWWYFYLVALAVKTPLPLIVAGPPALAWLAWRGWRGRDPWALAPLLLWVTLLIFASSFSQINIGVRHVLILYPLLCLGAGFGLRELWQSAARRSRPAGLAVRAVLLALVLWQVSALWRAYPDYLPYFNETVRDPERVLVDSDLDWGQDLYRLERRAHELGIDRLSIAYRGTADLAREPLPPLRILPPHERARGWVALSALARTRNLGDYAWLNAYRPVERIGRSIDLYYIP